MIQLKPWDGKKRFVTRDTFPKPYRTCPGMGILTESFPVEILKEKKQSRALSNLDYNKQHKDAYK